MTDEERDNSIEEAGESDEDFAVESEELPPVSAPESEPKRSLIGRAGHAVVYYLRQTFRRHGSMEYSELLTRGVRSAKGINRVYPWAYFRLFVLLFILYAVFVLIIRFTGNELFGPAVTALAAVMFNLPFLLLMFELYPRRDVSFISIISVLLMGGTAACVLAQAAFATFPSPNKWLGAVYAGFFEELSKAIVTVLAIVIAKKKSPLAGFLVGAAVGCGFSIVEDMGYIFLYSNELPALNLTSIIDVSITRGFTAFCTHTLWTALVGWAYCHFNRHLYNMFNYIVLLGVCGLHICWDLPLSYIGQAFVCAGCVVVAAVAAICIIVFERKAVFRAAGITKLGENYFKQDKKSVNERHYLYWKHWGNFTLALGAFVMAIIAVIYCSIPFRETYGTEKFKDSDSFILFMQNGKEYDYEENRPHNSHEPDKDIKTENGYISQVTQEVAEKDNTFSYVYSVIYDAVDDTYHYMLSSISVKEQTAEGAYIWYMKEDLYNEGKLYASFFHINTEVTGYFFESDGSLTVFIYDADFVRDLGEKRYVALFATFAAVFGVSLVCYVGLQIKSRSVKKQCMTDNAFSAE